MIADEDIYTGDGTLRAAKDTVVETLTTGEDGTAKSGLLYLGRYRLEERQAPSGCVLNPQPEYVDLTYAGETVAVSYTHLLLCMASILGLLPAQAFAMSVGQTASSWLGDQYVGSDGNHYRAPAPYTYLAYHTDGTIDVHTSSGGNAYRHYMLTDSDGISHQVYCVEKTSKSGHTSAKLSVPFTSRICFSTAIIHDGTPERLVTF